MTEILPPELINNIDIAGNLAFEQVTHSDSGFKPDLSGYETKLVRKLIDDFCIRLKKTEGLAKQDRQKLLKGQLPCSKVAALWVLSGPGYYREPFKEDRYKNLEWAKFMGRHRLAYAALLMRKYAEAASGASTTRPIDSKIKTRAMIEQYAPPLIFNGRRDENLDIEQILTEEGIVIPPSKVIIINAAIDNTIHQIKNFALPAGLIHDSANIIGIVSHAPHLVRAGYALPSDILSSGSYFRMFPLASPNHAVDYWAGEIRGFLYYALVSGDSNQVFSEDLFQKDN